MHAFFIQKNSYFVQERLIKVGITFNQAHTLYAYVTHWLTA